MLAFTQLATVVYATSLAREERLQRLSEHSPVISVARTPPMGWMSWQKYRCEDLKFDVIKKAFEEIAAHLRTFGYECVFIDDCWSKAARSRGELVADDSRGFTVENLKGLVVEFPTLKLGMYADVGTLTCEKRAGSQFSFAEDAQFFKDIGAKGLKVDGCNFQTTDRAQWNLQMLDAYIEFGGELRQRIPSILYSCSLPAYDQSTEFIDDAAELRDLARLAKCNLWRNYADIQPSVESLLDVIDFWAVDKDHPMIAAAGPGHWNDPDMLLIGEDIFTDNAEYAKFIQRHPAKKVDRAIQVSLWRMQMSLWAIFAAPLYLSTDVEALVLDRVAFRIATNKLVIAVNQDPLGKQGYVLHESSDLCDDKGDLLNQEGALVDRNGREQSKHTHGVRPCWRVWVRPLSDGFAVCLQNNSNRQFDVPYDASEHFKEYKAEDLWSANEVSLSELKTWLVPAFDVIMLKLTHSD